MSPPELHDSPDPVGPSEAIWTLVGQVIVHREDNEAIVLDLRTGATYGLRGRGLRVWQLLDRGATVRQIRDVIVKEYDVDVARCDVDVRTLLRELSVRGLIIPRRRTRGPEPPAN